MFDCFHEVAWCILCRINMGHIPSLCSLLVLSEVSVWSILLVLFFLPIQLKLCTIMSLHILLCDHVRLKLVLPWKNGKRTFFFWSMCQVHSTCCYTLFVPDHGIREFILMSYLFHFVTWYGFAGRGSSTWWMISQRYLRLWQEFLKSKPERSQPSPPTAASRASPA